MDNSRVMQCWIDARHRKGHAACPFKRVLFSRVLFVIELIILDGCLITSVWDERGLDDPYLIGSSRSYPGARSLDFTVG